MGLREMLGAQKSAPDPDPVQETSTADRCLSLLADGAARHMVELNQAIHRAFCFSIAAISAQYANRMTNDDKLNITRDIVEKFDNYRKNTEQNLRDRQNGWRMLGATLFHELIAILGIDPHSPQAQQLDQKLQRLTTAEEIDSWMEKLDALLHPIDPHGEKKLAGSVLKIADRSTENNNSTGLRGGGAAVEYLRPIMERGQEGFLVLFRLSCLDVISQRFGMPAVHDCIMDMSAYLTETLHARDAIFHWSDSVLLAILLDRPTDKILTAELQRLLAQNRESTIHVDGRSVMVRVPLSFDIVPITALRAPEDLYRLSAHTSGKK